jgi:dihydroorotate dehydrogenase (fumarate)
MMDLSTTYLGMKLRNPLVVSSSNLTSTIDKIIACEEHGAGAVVCKSLFEEQIDADTGAMLASVDESQHTSAYDYLEKSGRYHYLDDYLSLIEEARKRVSIPVIASVNCLSVDRWIDYAKRFEAVGANALELNVFILPADVRVRGEEIEKQYLDMCRKLSQKISIPISVKIGPHFSGLANMLARLETEGVRGFVLFNRFYQPDIDIERFQLIPAKIFSAPEEMALSLRWIALLSGEMKADFSAATGVHDSKAVIKQLLAGARTVQLCTTLYQNGLSMIPKMLDEISQWMERHHFSAIDDFNGKLCQERSNDPERYERAQYVKALVGIA